MRPPDQKTGTFTAPVNTQAGIVSQLRLAASFLTILPINPDQTDNAIVAASFRWFPLVGFVIGAIVAVEDWMLLAIFPVGLASVLVILSLIAITGAVHLDALADTADAFGAGRNRDRALNILRDSRVGTFGATAIFLSLTLKIVALSSLAEPRRFIALFTAIGLSRWAMVAVAGGLEYLRAEGGAGATLLQRDSGSLTFASIATVLALMITLTPRAMGAALVAVALVLAARWFYQRWLGGVTGDLIGACGEIVEIAVLVLFAAG